MTVGPAWGDRRVGWHDFVVAAGVAREQEITWWYQFAAWALEAGYYLGPGNRGHGGEVWLPHGLEPADVVAEWRVSRWGSAWR